MARILIAVYSLKKGLERVHQHSILLVALAAIKRYTAYMDSLASREPVNRERARSARRRRVVVGDVAGSYDARVHFRSGEGQRKSGRRYDGLGRERRLAQ